MFSRTPLLLSYAQCDGPRVRTLTHTHTHTHIPTHVSTERRHRLDVLGRTLLLLYAQCDGPRWLEQSGWMQAGASKGQLELVFSSLGCNYETIEGS